MKAVVIQVQADYNRAESSGASGHFQVISVTKIDENGNRCDLTHEIDQGKVYPSAKELLEDLGLDPEVHVEFV